MKLGWLWFGVSVVLAALLYVQGRFAAHMAAHLLLSLGAAPALIFALPGWRPRVPAWLGFLSLNLVTYFLHMPTVYARLMSPAGDLLVAALFLVGGQLFWLAVRRGGASAFILLVVQMLACALLGALVTFSRPGAYMTTPGDLTLGGVLMWVGGGAVFMGMALWRLSRLLNHWKAVAA